MLISSRVRFTILWDRLPPRRRKSLARTAFSPSLVDRSLASLSLAYVSSSPLLSYSGHERGVGGLAPRQDQAGYARQARGLHPPGCRGGRANRVPPGDFLRPLFLRGAADPLVRLHGRDPGRPDQSGSCRIWRANSSSPSSSRSTSASRTASFYNTAAVIAADGQYLGKYRKGGSAAVEVDFDLAEARRARISVFGSWATGQAARTSDIDVAVLPLEPLLKGTLSEIRRRWRKALSIPGRSGGPLGNHARVPRESRAGGDSLERLTERLAVGGRHCPLCRRYCGSLRIASFAARPSSAFNTHSKRLESRAGATSRTRGPELVRSVLFFAPTGPWRLVCQAFSYPQISGRHGFPGQGDTPVVSQFSSLRSS